jgi:hypothetical protein
MLMLTAGVTDERVTSRFPPKTYYDGPFGSDLTTVGSESSESSDTQQLDCAGSLNSKPGEFLPAVVLGFWAVGI